MVDRSVEKKILKISLTDKSREKLLIEVKPSFETVFADHVTLLHGVVPERYLSLVGKRQVIKVEEFVGNNLIEAARVTIDPTLPCKNAVPHITISVRKNIRPSRANEMFCFGTPTETKKVSFELEGVIELVNLE